MTLRVSAEVIEYRSVTRAQNMGWPVRCNLFSVALDAVGAGGVENLKQQWFQKLSGRIKSRDQPLRFDGPRPCR